VSAPKCVRLTSELFIDLFSLACSSIQSEKDDCLLKSHSRMGSCRRPRGSCTSCSHPIIRDLAGTTTVPCNGRHRKHNLWENVTIGIQNHVVRCCCTTSTGRSRMQQASLLQMWPYIRISVPRSLPLGPRALESRR
jgi:hypothetical protein